MKDATVQSGVYGTWRVAWGTHVGRSRKTNEDAVLVRDNGKGALMMVVADGLGGQAAGEVASGLAVDTLEQAFARTERPGPELESMVNSAHEAILRQADQDLEQTGMSTTCSALVFENDTYWISHVGDTRIYRIDREMHRLTQDHTWEASINRMGDSAYMPAAARHVLTRCLGTRNTFAIDSNTASWEDEDRGFLLCTDGLYGQVPDEVCFKLWALEPEEAVRQMIQAALDSGGPDNISVIVAHRER